VLIPLTKREAARLLRALCLQHRVSPAAVVREIKDDGVPVSDVLILRYEDGIYFLQPIIEQEHLHHRFVIFIDGVPKLSRADWKAAYKLASDLCHVLPLAREIRLADTLKDATVATWTQFKDRVGNWVVS